ncbi:MAG: cation:proton antiporter [bacterium]
MHAVLTLLLQVGVILAVSRLVGLSFRRIQQPQVMGEMVAGILLGPSFFGWVAPALSAQLFPPASLSALQALSQTGLVLFMFLVGVELDPKLLRGRGETAVLTSHASIVAPFFLGSALALYLYPRLSDDSVHFTGFALFMGAAMSVTAFPVLARILTERNLLRTKVGAVTIACAAVDDVSAWCILAAVVTLVRAESAPSELPLTLGGSALFALVMLTGVRRAVARFEVLYRNRGRVMSQDMIAALLLLMIASAWTTERLGIHALFGAFLMGAILPKDGAFVRDLTSKLEDLTVVFLLPVFFAFTGLRTHIGLIQGAEMWLECGLILLVAVTGKLGGSALAARATGLSWREAGALGTLMNTRGLMELVILTIGLDLGIISPALFVMMVLMAIITTFMTTPLLEWIYPSRLIRQDAAEEEPTGDAILIPISLPAAGPELLRVAEAVIRKPDSAVYGLHLMRVSDQSLLDAQRGGRAEFEPLEPLLDAARARGLDVHPLEFVSRDPAADITAVAHAKGARLIVMGWHKPVLGHSILSGTVHDVMRDARCDVAVYVQRHFGPWRRVLVPYLGGLHDRGALELARRMSRKALDDAGQSKLDAVDRHITILHVIPPGRRPGDESAGLSAAASAFRAEQLELKVVEARSPLDAVVAEAQRGYDLVIVGVAEQWGLEPRMFAREHERLAAECPASLLIVRKYRAPGERTDAISRAGLLDADTPAPASAA